jgi:hypothetical protein
MANTTAIISTIINPINDPIDDEEDGLVTLVAITAIKVERNIILVAIAVIEVKRRNIKRNIIRAAIKVERNIIKNIIAILTTIVAIIANNDPDRKSVLL